MLASLFILELIYICIKSPYKGDRKNWRPKTNMIITITILALYYLMNSMKMPILILYGPLLVLILLFVCFVYSTIALVFDLKQRFTEYCK